MDKIIKIIFLIQKRTKSIVLIMKYFTPHKNLNIASKNMINKNRLKNTIFTKTWSWYKKNEQRDRTRSNSNNKWQFMKSIRKQIFFSTDTKLSFYKNVWKSNLFQNNLILSIFFIHWIYVTKAITLYNGLFRTATQIRKYD